MELVVEVVVVVVVFLELSTHLKAGGGGSLPPSNPGSLPCIFWESLGYSNILLQVVRGRQRVHR
jgi:hypothetical protein